MREGSEIENVTEPVFEHSSEPVGAIDEPEFEDIPEIDEPDDDDPRKPALQPNYAVRGELARVLDSAPPEEASDRVCSAYKKQRGNATAFFRLKDDFGAIVDGVPVLSYSRTSVNKAIKTLSKKTLKSHGFFDLQRTLKRPLLTEDGQVIEMRSQAYIHGDDTLVMPTQNYILPERSSPMPCPTAQSAPFEQEGWLAWLTMLFAIVARPLSRERRIFLIESGASAGLALANIASAIAAEEFDPSIFEIDKILVDEIKERMPLKVAILESSCPELLNRKLMAPLLTDDKMPIVIATANNGRVQISKDLAKFVVRIPVKKYWYADGGLVERAKDTAVATYVGLLALVRDYLKANPLSSKRPFSVFSDIANWAISKKEGK